MRIPKQEQEVHMISNPSVYKDRSLRAPLVGHRSRSQSPTPSNASSTRRKRLADDDYEAPSTSHALQKNSNWLIVRRNLHRIRFMGYNDRLRDNTMPDLYIGFQMKRELKRAQEEIKNIDKEENFHAIRNFALAVDNKRIKNYDTSHVKPEDALTYDRLGEEPLPLQNLLYYFSKQDVSHGTLFWDFLNEVNRVLDMKRKRTVLVQRLRQLALTLAVILYCVIGLMLVLLIISAITTATKMNDPEVQWMEPSKFDAYARDSVSSSSSSWHTNTDTFFFYSLFHSFYRRLPAVHAYCSNYSVSFLYLSISYVVRFLEIKICSTIHSGSSSSHHNRWIFAKIQPNRSAFGLWSNILMNRDINNRLSQLRLP